VDCTQRLFVRGGKSVNAPAAFIATTPDWGQNPPKPGWIFADLGLGLLDRGLSGEFADFFQ
jgi:hypothetical protein